jgi:hypothetical protein
VTTVVDASVALRWCFQLKGSDRAEQLFRSNDQFIAPDLVITSVLKDRALAIAIELRDPPVTVFI